MRTTGRKPMDHAVPVHNSYRGRKMKPGKYLPGPPRIFVTYCEECNSKVTVPLEYMKYFQRGYARETKSLRVKLLRLLMKGMGIENI